ncbi:hypothetical protein [Ideonella sp. B508-1]|uniref:hypothetical protein n=1 Tax=Ideonella sp. B508-1 TaxID=137716 RepID=UPI0011D1934F|nr:hypothetical protein [Ideonella sp. B508-1]
MTSLFGLFLAVACLLACISVLCQHYEGSWGGLFVFMICFPASLPGLFIGDLMGADLGPFIIVAGSVQWYAVGWCIERAVKRIKSRAHRR